MDYVKVDESKSMTPDLRRIVGYRPSSYFTARSGQLGWALPAAAGISFVKKKVLCVIGDGSFMYTPQTLWTIKRYNLPVKLLVLDNRGYVILRSFAKSYYQNMQDRDFLQPEIHLKDLIESFGIECKTATADLSEMEWLAAGSDSKALIVEVKSEVPKLFI